MNAHMKRPARWSLAAAVLLSSAALPASASAKITEIGALADGVAPGCPVSCQAITRLTGYQAKVGPDRDLYQAQASGYIVSWTIALGKRTSALFRCLYKNVRLTYSATFVSDATTAPTR